MTCFVEWLTVRIWLTHVLPWLAARRRRGAAAVVRCVALEGTRAGVAVARATAWLIRVRFTLLEFQLKDVHDEHGYWIAHRVATGDLAKLQQLVVGEPALRRFVAARTQAPRLEQFLKKALTRISFCDRGSVWRSLLVLQVCRWVLRRAPQTDRTAVVFMQRQPWIGPLARTARQHGLALVPVLPPWEPVARLRRRIPSDWRRSLVLSIRRAGGRVPYPGRWAKRSAAPAARRIDEHAPAARIAVEYYGHLNTEHPELHSDLFFWQQGPLDGHDVLVTFGLPDDPLDAAKHAELARHGIAAVALGPTAAAEGLEASVIGPVHARRHVRRLAETLNGPSEDHRSLTRMGTDYERMRAEWTRLFVAYGVKVYVTWFKYSPHHCAIGDALRDVGGVLAFYQRALESMPSAETAVFSDVFFGYSQQAAEIEQGSGSQVPYYVITGYLGDHRFSMLRGQAQRIRDQLARRGARRVLAFSDENSKPDGRWQAGQTQMRENYRVLLERVLCEQWLGLIIKPKVSATLRQRLGPLARLFDEAQQTGRCVVLNGGALHNSFPPAVAALAADVMVHSHLVAATAGFEAALVGIPSILLDQEGWAKSPLYALGVGRVVFTDWPSFWAACGDHWRRPGGVPGFGDWSAQIDQFDPFRDGQAACRMGTFLRWLLDGLRAGEDREAALARAAERYAQRWGKGMVRSVGPTAGWAPSVGETPCRPAPATACAQGALW